MVGIVVIGGTGSFFFTFFLFFVLKGEPEGGSQSLFSFSRVKLRADRLSLMWTKMAEYRFPHRFEGDSKPSVQEAGHFQVEGEDKGKNKEQEDAMGAIQSCDSEIDRCQGSF